jgi:hypothetical protein
MTSALVLAGLVMLLGLTSRRSVWLGRRRRHQPVGRTRVGMARSGRGGVGGAERRNLTRSPLRGAGPPRAKIHRFSDSPVRLAFGEDGVTEIHRFSD